VRRESVILVLVARSYLFLVVWRGLLVRHLSWLLFSISWGYRLALPLLKLGWLWPDLLPRRYVVIPLMPEVG
jgi:hypothetical protein